ncbi:unnamed protein product [Effrenium voratum]|uniref:Cyclin N-terminal domain-containing protein n=1 Tax=Effrenium voratum TaxID=2562239 RepID=A0AA36NIS1_9DINO|nr:unnamed protein product [Effrenium voratum]CAJ1413190.1 unnamed protein product [Effrenium voratum]
MVLEEPGELFSKEALEHAQEAANERAAQVLREHKLRDPPRPLSLSQGVQLVNFYGQKLPELCKLCSAPSEVCWTALVFFRRFYAAASAMEFDPATTMYAAVHVACKIEEVREITLDRLLEVSGFGEDAAMKTKVTDLELELLERIGFRLLVEPKPGAALRVLAEDSRERVPGFPLSQEALQELLARAESLVFELCACSHAVLHYPASIIFSAAWGTALDEGSGLDRQPGAAPSCALLAMLAETFKDPADREALSSLLKEVLKAMKQVSCETGLGKAAMQDIAKIARKCHRAFGFIHDERKQRHEAHRKERKRRRNDLKDKEATMFRIADFADLKQKAQALQSHAMDEDFVIHGPRDMEED